MAKRILIVEDSKNIREIVSLMLRNRGYEVVEAVEGDDGMKKAKQGGYDLIVLDAMLPNVTGFDICNALKADPKLRRIPVILLTAITQGSDKSDEYWKQKTRADDFMSKPFRVRELMDRIDKLIGNSGGAGSTAQPPAQT